MRTQDVARTKRLSAAREGVVKALEFYADSAGREYACKCAPGDVGPCHCDDSPITLDDGDCARAALKELEKAGE